MTFETAEDVGSADPTYDPTYDPTHEKSPEAAVGTASGGGKGRSPEGFRRGIEQMLTR